MAAIARAPPHRRITLWFKDEARAGQKGRVCHRWWTRGQRPPGLCDQRCTRVRICAAVRPATGEDLALVLPHVPAAAMNGFLRRFAATRPPDEHTVMVLDGAGWHDLRAIRIPDNVSLVILPPCSPGSNPVERVWLRLRDDCDAAVEACCQAWCRLAPGRPGSLTACPYLREVIRPARRYQSVVMPFGSSR